MPRKKLQHFPFFELSKQSYFVQYAKHHM